MFTTETAVRELDRRINDGFDVRLLFHHPFAFAGHYAREMPCVHHPCDA